MYVTYRLKPYELTDDFFNVLKTTFQDKEIAISVEEVQDATDYLLSTEANRKHLFEGLEAVKRGKVVHTMTLEELEAMIE